MTTRMITATDLERLRACPEQVALFRATFGEDAAINAENVARAVAAGLGVVWLATGVFTPEAVDAYDRACIEAWDVCGRAPTEARNAYNRACSEAGDAYSRACTEAWDAYDRACTEAWAAYDRACTEVAGTLLSDPTNWRADL